MCEFKKLKDIKRGEYIRKNATTEKTYKRGEYCRELKKYSLIDCDDINRELFLKGENLVYVGFTY
jgi:hypothetical protein